MGYWEVLKQIIRERSNQFLAFMGGREISHLSFVARTMDQEDIESVKVSLKDKESWTNQDLVMLYEERFACWNGSRFAFSFMGGRVALSAIIHALGLKTGDEVLVPGYTCVVVPNAFRFAGIDVKYVDIELQTYGVDIVDLKRKISPRTRAILLQHLYGLVSRDYEAILSLAKDHRLFVIEDCAQATGARFKGERVGNRGDAALYSTEHSKVFSTFIGGVAATNDERIAAGIREYQSMAPWPATERVEAVLNNLIYDYVVNKRCHSLGRDWYRLKQANKVMVSTTETEMNFQRPTHYGQRMPAPLAQVGLCQLKKVDRYNDIRRENAKRWDGWCDAYGVTRAWVVNDSEPVFLRYPVMLDSTRKQDRSWAHDLGVPVGVWFCTNLHPIKYTILDCPNADKAVAECVNFPTL
jgi:perosamine synthetase